jgi:hypothetical protein
MGNIFFRPSWHFFTYWYSDTYIIYSLITKHNEKNHCFLEISVCCGSGRGSAMDQNILPDLDGIQGSPFKIRPFKFENNRVPLTLGSFQFFSKLLGDIRKPRCTTVPLVLLILVENLPPVLMIPVSNLPPVSVTLMVNFHRYQ